MKFSTLLSTLAVSALLSIALLIGIMFFAACVCSPFANHKIIEQNQNTTAIVNQINKADF